MATNMQVEFLIVEKLTTCTFDGSIGKGTFGAGVKGIGPLLPPVTNYL